MAQIVTFENLPIVDTGGRSLIAQLRSNMTTQDANLRNDMAEQDAKKISFPNDGADFGNAGDQLRSLGDGSVEWAAPGMPTYEQTEQAISDWLNEHPEAVTTVEDGAITDAKLNDALRRSLVYGFETVTDQNTGMKYANNLVAGMICHTNGFHVSGDGGAAWYEITDTGEANGKDVIECGELFANLIHDSIVTPEMFGAYGNGTTNDAPIINYIIQKLNGGRIDFGAKTYLVGAPIVMKRGVELNGAATFDDQFEDSSTCIKLADNANCSVIQTPAAGSGNDTHYFVISNLLIDGNKENQAEETIAVNFTGAYIGSRIENVYIKNFYGCALNLTRTDIELENIWLQNGVSINYSAFETNHGIASGNFNLIDIGNMFIENISNKVGGNPRNNVDDRANGMKINRVANLNANELHFEGVATPVEITDSWAVNIASAHSAWCGTSECGFITFTGSCRTINAVMLSVTSTAAFEYWVLKNGFVSNTISNLSYNYNYPVLAYYTATANSSYQFSITPKEAFANEAGVMKIGTTDASRFKMFSDSESTANYGFLKQGAVRTEIGSNKNQTGEKTFFAFDSNGGSGDRAFIYEPIQFPKERESAANVYANSVYRVNASMGSGLAYQRTTGANTGIEMFATVARSSGAPANNPLYVGQICIDTTNKKVYIGVSLTEWKELQ